MWEKVASAAYKRVADQLRVAIRAGEWEDGAKLPSLGKLGERYGVSIDVARQAIATLRSEGLVETRQGAATYVRRFERIVRRSPARLAREWWGAGHAIQDRDTELRPRSMTPTVGEMPAPADVASALGVEPGEPIVFRGRRFTVEGRPVQLSTSYFPVELARGTPITYTDTGPGGVYARLADQGVGPDRFVERIDARAPYPDEAADLALPGSGGLVFEITRFALCGDRCVEVNRMVLDAASYTLENSFPA